jgi:hypothetical protein
VVDSDSKKKLLRLLKAEQAAKMMEAEGPSAAGAAKKAKKPKSKVKVTAVKKAAAKGAAKAAAMET